MYDETTGTTYRLGPAPPHHPGQHWYDEPPYESDPDDFLMGGQYGPAATIQVSDFSLIVTLNVFLKLEIIQTMIKYRSQSNYIVTFFFD